ncbi:MAG: sigma factor-like helix-turn-helix DNA-binding protein [Desulfococcaceae bacterium]
MPPDDEKPGEKPEADPRRLSQWLSENLPDDRLLKMARAIGERVRSRKRRHRFNIRFLGMENWSETELDDSDPLPKAIAGELVRFLSDKPALLDQLSASPGPEAATLLRDKFLNAWLDFSRSLSVDPKRYLYKKARTAISDSEDFHFVPDRQGQSKFSRKPTSTPLHFLLDDLERITFPADIALDPEEVRKAGILKRLADHFLREAVRDLAEEDVLVRVADFVSWIQLHVRQPEIVRRDDHFPGRGGEDVPRSGRAKEKGAERKFVSPAQLQGWVEEFLPALSPKDARLLRLRFGEELTLEETAAEMGWKSPGTTSNHLARILGRMRIFLESHSLHDDPAVLEDFLFLLLHHLKKENPEP